MAGGWGGEPTDANISVGILVKDADRVLACQEIPRLWSIAMFITDRHWSVSSAR